jgi:hypothetical protein
MKVGYKLKNGFIDSDFTINGKSINLDDTEQLNCYTINVIKNYIFEPINTYYCIGLNKSKYGLIRIKTSNEILKKFYKIDGQYNEVYK